jgi:hypothetical protein
MGEVASTYLLIMASSRPGWVRNSSAVALPSEATAAPGDRSMTVGAGVVEQSSMVPSAGCVDSRADDSHHVRAIAFASLGDSQPSARFEGRNEMITVSPRICRKPYLAQESRATARRAAHR